MISTWNNLWIACSIWAARRPVARRWRVAMWPVLATFMSAIPTVARTDAADPASQPAKVSVLPAGYIPHMTAVPGGRIDWTTGTLLVEGVGKARGTDEQQRSMAERAATLVAARNAMNVAAGVQIDRYGKFADLREGTVQIEGMIRGHFAVDVNWDPSATPPTCTILLGVPLWGIKGLSAVVFDEVRTRARSAAHMPIVSTEDKSFDADEYIVIDARGAKVRPCLFPLILNADNRVLYDASIRRQYHGDILPTVQYVEIAQQCGAAPAKPDAKDESRPRLHRVKAMAMSETVKTDIYIGRDDVITIANDVRLATLLRAGRILVVMETRSMAQGVSPTR